MPGTLGTEPLLTTLGVHYFDPADPPAANLFWRPAGTPNWLQGHDLVRIDAGHLAGSLFHLAPGTSYEVRVVIGADDLMASGTTWADTPVNGVLRDVYVDAQAPPGGTGTAAAPFSTIAAAAALALPGDRIRIRPGIYHESLTLTRDGAPDHYVLIAPDPAAPGAVVLDGSAPNPALAWQPTATPNVHRSAIPNTFAYLARDGERFYEYDDLTGCQTGTGHGATPIPEGWVIANGQLHVRCLDAPGNHSWQLPQFEHAIQMNSDYVWVEGLEMRYYGLTWPKGVYIREGGHNIVRNNVIHHCGTGVWIKTTGGFATKVTDNRVEGNTLYDTPVHEWPWAAVKGTSHENSGVVIAGGYRTLARDNIIYHYFNGVYTGSFSDHAKGLAFEVEVTGHRMLDITDDGLEPEGACVNHRFIGNTIDRVHSGVSLAPIVHGPTWVLRNRFTGVTGSALKFSNSSPGPCFLYHNTGYTDLPAQNAVSVSGPYANMTLRNNVMVGTRYAFENSSYTGSNDDWDHDNWFTTDPSRFVKYNGVKYGSIGQLFGGTGLEQHGFDHDPQLIDPAGFRFGLAPGSPNIDAGVVIPGIDDSFSGAAPDLGYAEYGATEPGVVCLGAITAYGSGCPGSGGLVPALAFSGCTTPGGTLTLAISAGLGGAPAFLFFGLKQGALPMDGTCTLNVVPLLAPILGPLKLAGAGPGAGTFVLAAPVPATLGAFTVTTQAFVVDPGTPPGFANTNGIALDVR